MTKRAFRPTGATGCLIDSILSIRAMTEASFGHSARLPRAK